MDVLAPGEAVSTSGIPVEAVSDDSTVTDPADVKEMPMSKGWWGHGQPDWVHYQTYLAALIKDAQAAGVLATKDSEAKIIAQSDAQFIQTIQDVKDAESRILKDAGDKFIHTIQDVKDSESRLTERLHSGNMALFGAIKDAQTAAALASCHTDHGVERESAAVQALVNSNASAAMMFASQNQANVLMLFKDQSMQLAEVKASLAAQIAECCCEVKGLVTADGAETRELINELKTADLRDRLHKLELAEMVTNKVTQVGLGNIAIPTATGVRS
jgi:hypothetical protein